MGQNIIVLEIHIHEWQGLTAEISCQFAGDYKLAPVRSPAPIASKSESIQHRRP